MSKCCNGAAPDAFYALRRARPIGVLHILCWALGSHAFVLSALGGHTPHDSRGVDILIHYSDLGEAEGTEGLGVTHAHTLDRTPAGPH